MEQVKVPGGTVPRLPSPKPRRRLGSEGRSRSRSRHREVGHAALPEPIPEPIPEVVPSNTVALYVEGFKEEALDGWYRRRDKCIITGSPAFFNNKQGSSKLFMYKQASGRWVISPVRAGKEGEDDLLRAARQGQDRGVACQKAARGGFNSWREFYQGRWVETKLTVEMFNFEQYEREKRRSQLAREQRQALALPAPVAPVAPVAPLPARGENQAALPVPEPAAFEAPARAELPPRSAPVAPAAAAPAAAAPAAAPPLTEKDVQKMLLRAQAETKQRERKEQLEQELEQRKEEQLRTQHSKQPPPSAPKGTSSLLALAAKLHAPPEAGFMSSAMKRLEVERHLSAVEEPIVASSTPKEMPQVTKSPPQNVFIPKPTSRAGAHGVRAPQVLGPPPSLINQLMMPQAGPLPIGQVQAVPGWQASAIAGPLAKAMGAMPQPGFLSAYGLPQGAQTLPPPPPPPPLEEAANARAPVTPPKTSTAKGFGKDKVNKAKSSPETDRVRSFLQCLNGEKALKAPAEDLRQQKAAEQETTHESKSWNDWKAADGDDWQNWSNKDWSNWHNWREDWQGSYGKKPQEPQEPEEKPNKKAKKEDKKDKKDKKKDKKEKQKESPPKESLPGLSPEALAHLEGKAVGVIKSYLPLKRYGFITSSDCARDLYFKSEDLPQFLQERQNLAGSKVKFQLRRYPNGNVQAKRVEVLEPVGGAPVMHGMPQNGQPSGAAAKVAAVPAPAKAPADSAAVLAALHAARTEGTAAAVLAAFMAAKGEGQPAAAPAVQDTAVPSAPSVPSLAQGRAALAALKAKSEGFDSTEVLAAFRAASQGKTSAAADVRKAASEAAEASKSQGSKSKLMEEEDAQVVSEASPSAFSGFLLPASGRPFPATVEGFCSFMVERERIRLRRARGDPWPWTSDVILKHLRVRNVKRQHDRSIIFMRRLVKDHPIRADTMQQGMEEYLWNLCIWRRFGTLHFMDKLGYVPMAVAEKEMPDLVKVAMELWRSGVHACTDAYGPAVRCHALELAAWHPNPSDLASTWAIDAPSVRAKRRRMAVTEDGLQSVKKAYQQLWNEKIGLELLKKCRAVVNALFAGTDQQGSLKNLAALMASVPKQGGSDGVYAAELLQDFFSLAGMQTFQKRDQLELDAPTKRCLRQMLPNAKEPPVQLMVSVLNQSKELWPSSIEEQPSVQLQLTDVRGMVAEFDRYLRAVEGKPTRMPFRPMI